MRLPMKCTKMHQNGPERSKYHDRAKVFQICPNWPIWSIFGLDGHLKRESSQNKLWRGHGVAHKVQQNATKCNKMHQNVHSNMTELSIFNLSSVTYVTISGLSGHLKGQSNRSRSLRGHGVAHNVQQNATKLTKMHQNSHCTITEQRISNLSRVTYVIHFWSKWTLKRG